MSPKQKQVIRYLHTVDQASLEDIYSNVNISYYANWKANLSKFMTRMVRSGYVERIKPGLFKYATHRKPNQEFTNTRQLNLFN